MLLPSGLAFHSIHVLEELKQRFPIQWEAVDQYIQKGWDGIRLLVQKGIRNEEIREFNFELFIQVYIGAFYRLMEHQYEAQDGLSLENALAQMVELLLNGIYT
ncbi:hypothetical protein D3C77_567220 [compost metagenome]